MFNRQAIIYDYKSERLLNVGSVGLYSDKENMQVKI